MCTPLSTSALSANSAIAAAGASGGASSWHRVHVRRGLLAMVLLAGFTLNCASVRSVSMTHVPRVRGEAVSASAHDWALFNWHFSNDFVQEVHQSLLAKCPDGNIGGVFTKYETVTYPFVVKRIITANGFCSKEAPPSENQENIVGGPPPAPAAPPTDDTAQPPPAPTPMEEGPAKK